MIAPRRDAKGRRIFRVFPVQPRASYQAATEQTQEGLRARDRRWFAREGTGFAERDHAPLPGDIGGRRALPVFED